MQDWTSYIRNDTYDWGTTPFISVCQAFSCAGDLNLLLCDTALPFSEAKSPGHSAITRTDVVL